MTDEEKTKWDKFHSREDVIMFRTKAQLARNAHIQSDVSYWERRLMDLARNLGLIKEV
jgi:hypothetical protein